MILRVNKVEKKTTFARLFGIEMENLKYTVISEIFKPGMSTLEQDSCI